MSYVDPSGSQAWMYMASHLFELLRNAAWAMLMAFATVGACWAGGAATTAAVTAIRRRDADPDPVIGEAERGIAEIESFLAARSEPSRHPADDDADRRPDG